MAYANAPSRSRNPELIFDTLNAYQKTAALRAAIELDVFTAIGEGADTVAALAKRCQATERGIRILCDYLTIIGFLTKHGQQYALTRGFRDVSRPALARLHRSHRGLSHAARK